MTHYARSRESFLQSVARALGESCRVVASCTPQNDPTVTVEREAPTVHEALSISRMGYSKVSWVVRFPDGREVPL